MRAFLIALLSTLLAAPLAAQDSSDLRSLITGDDSRGWNGVGRLDIGRRGFCTGALIAPDLVLTAAHCLFESETGQRIGAAEIEFLAGWRNGRATAYRGVRRVALHPDYEFAEQADMRLVAADIALLELDAPIRNTSVTPFAIGERPRKGDDVAVVSYAHDRALRPSLEEACRVLARPAGGLVLSCTVDFGSSGAPVFVNGPDGPRIVSVVSAKAEAMGRMVSLGAGLGAPLDALRAQLSETDGVFTRTQPPVRRLTIEQSRGQSGAKFLRP